jgi:hypothetical protein
MAHSPGYVFSGCVSVFDCSQFSPLYIHLVSRTEEREGLIVFSAL